MDDKLGLPESVSNSQRAKQLHATFSRILKQQIEKQPLSESQLKAVAAIGLAGVTATILTIKAHQFYQKQLSPKLEGRRLRTPDIVRYTIETAELPPTREIFNIIANEIGIDPAVREEMADLFYPRPLTIEPPPPRASSDLVNRLKERYKKAKP